MSNDGRVPENTIARRASGASHAGAAAPQPVSSPDLLLPESEPAFWRFVSNLAACISAPPRDVPPRAWMHSPMFRSGFLLRGDPSRGLLLSALLHVIAITAIVSAPLYDFSAAAWLFQETDPLPPRHEVIYYARADLLPLISPPKPKAAARLAPSRAAVKLALQPAQRIVSKPPAPDNRRQTILQPEVPKLSALAEVRVPNMIRWSAPDLPPPVVPTDVRRPAAKPAPEPPAPVRRVMPSLPMPQALRADASVMPLAPLAAVKAPKLPVPVRIARAAAPAPAPAARQTVARTAPELPSAPAGEANAPPSAQLELANLIAISVAPAPPAEDVVIPMGRRAGEFSAAPEGSGEESIGIPSTDSAIATTATGREGLSGEEGAEIHVPDLSISGAGPPRGPSSLGGTDPATDLRQLMARASRPRLTPGFLPRPATAPGAGSPAGKDRRLEAEFFGARRVYTVYMNMPNLTSAAGSWVLRFAELDERGNRQDADGELATPEAFRKVDPMYVASAARERVQGTVTLAAVVLRDGTLANIRVVGSLDPRLDSSAVAALTQWRFHPARKNGAPVDLEVLVQIPFRISSL